jgi:hypothetical protein
LTGKGHLFYISAPEKTQSIHTLSFKPAGWKWLRACGQELERTIDLFTKGKIRYKRLDLDGKLAAKPFTKPKFQFEMLYSGGKSENQHFRKLYATSVIRKSRLPNMHVSTGYHQKH